MKLGKQIQEQLEEIIRGAAMRAERRIAVVRCFLLVAMGIRFIWTVPPWRMPIDYAPLIVGIAYSIYVLATNRDTATPSLLLGSVILDASLCVAGLLPNILWPVADNICGIMRTEEIHVFFLATFASGLRVSTLAAIGGSLATLAGYGILNLSDWLLMGTTYGVFHPAVLASLYLAGAGVLTVLVARNTKYLVEKAASQAAQTERALHGLTAEHHDAASVLTSASMNVDFLLETIESEDREEGQDSESQLLESRVAGVRRDLQELRIFLKRMQERASVELLLSQERDKSMVALGVEECVARARLKFPGIGFAVGLIPAYWQVTVAGGAAAFHRILWNVLVNAGEGDGIACATAVEITADVVADTGLCEFTIADNGPGFPDEVLKRALNEYYSTKPNGSGIGLGSAADLIHASDGSIRIHNGRRGGAIVTFRLPLGRPYASASDESV